MLLRQKLNNTMKTHVVAQKACNTSGKNIFLRHQQFAEPKENNCVCAKNIHRVSLRMQTQPKHEHSLGFFAPVS